MKNICIFALLLVLTQTQARAQQPTDGLSVPRFDNGTTANGNYTNECLGFSLPIPLGWEINTQGYGGDGKARHLPSGGLGLLVIDRHTGRLFGNRIAVTALDANRFPGTTKDFVTNAVQGQINVDPLSRELIRGAFAVDYAGKDFFRSDYKQASQNGSTLYLAFVYTKFRGYFIGETLIAGSPEELDESADSLRRISFKDDQPNPKCFGGGEDAPVSTGIIGGVISSTSSAPQSGSGRPLRVRVSQGVSQALLLKEVQPQYPEAARQSHIQGSVVLKALIDTNGDVEELTLVSGDPLLAPAAIDAVKQWKYKPYLLQSQPVKVETQITVAFQLLAN